jgi:glycine/D-amino acid oxidase-like deaminating enzyme
VILGGGRSIAPKPYELDTPKDGALQPRVSKYLRDFLPDNFPSLFPNDEKVEIDFEWAGIMGFTKSRMPYVGQVYDADGRKEEGCWVLAGYSGHGMSRAPCW